MRVTAAQLAEFIDGTVDGDPDVELWGMGGLREASEGDVSFLANRKYESLLAETGASAVIVAEDCATSSRATLIRVKHPDGAFAQLAESFGPPPIEHVPGVHPTAEVAEDAEIGNGASIGPFVTVSAQAKIGAGTVIEAGCFVGQEASIGEDGHLYPNVTVLDRAELGDRVIVHSGTVVGSDGFGYTTRVEDDGRVVVEKVPQVGIVSIGNDVELGSNVSVDRARFGKTSLGNCVKVDNLVQIAHNVKVGDYSGIVGQSAIAGSVEIGSRAIVWGHSAVAGHLKIGDDAQVAGHSGVTKDVPPGEFVAGAPAVPRRELMRAAMNNKQVPKLKKRVKALEERIERMEALLASKENG